MTSWTDPPELPNVGQLTGTTVPLVATVLAGFSVGMLAQVAMLQKNAWTEGLYALLVWEIGLVIFVPFLIASALMGAWGQSYDTTSILALPDTLRAHLYEGLRGDVKEYVEVMHDRWAFWHDRAIYMFYIGQAAFVVGTFGIVLSLIGVQVAVVYGLAVVVCCGIWLDTVRRAGV